MSGAVLEQQPVEVIIRPMLTMNRAVDLFLADISRRGYSERTRTTYSRLLDKLCDRFPVDHDVSKVTTDDISRYLDQWSHRARGTQAHAEAVVSSFFRFLYLAQKITRNPVDRLARTRRIPPADLDVVTVSMEDVQRMMMHAVSWPEKLTIGVLAYTGCRRRAASRLRLTDYDRARRRLRFREKGGKTSWKLIADDLDSLIEAAIASGCYEETDYLIPPAGPLVRKGDRDDRCIYDIVKRVAGRAGVEAHAHALRAAFACFYLEAHPGDVEALKELLGHRSIQTTQVYLRKFDTESAMERVRDLSWGVSMAVADQRDTRPRPMVMSGSASEETTDPLGYVYFIAAGDHLKDGTPVKIGYSAEPAARMRDLQTSHAHRLTLLATIEGTMADETALHLEFAASRLQGEWFASSEALRTLIAKRGNSHIRIRHEIPVEPLAVSPLMGAGGFEPPFEEPPLAERDSAYEPGDEPPRPPSSGAA